MRPTTCDIVSKYYIIVETGTRKTSGMEHSVGSPTLLIRIFGNDVTLLFVTELICTYTGT